MAPNSCFPYAIKTTVVGSPNNNNRKTVYMEGFFNALNFNLLPFT